MVTALAWTALALRHVLLLAALTLAAGSIGGRLVALQQERMIRLG